MDQKLLTHLATQNQQELSNLITEILSFSEEEAVPILESQEVFESLSFHFQWDHAGESSDPICKWFFLWFQTNSKKFQYFVLRFLPSFLWTYLFKYSHGVIPIGIEAILVSIYNTHSIASGRKQQFQCPVVTNPSIYGQFNFQAPTKADLESDLSIEDRTIIAPSLNIIGGGSSESLNATNRFLVIKVCLLRFFEALPTFSESTLVAFLRFTQSLAACGVNSLSYQESETALNGFFHLTSESKAENAVEAEPLRRFIDGKENIQVPHDLVLWKEHTISLPIQVQNQILKIFSNLLFKKNLEQLTLNALQIWKNRAELDLQPEVLLMANALLHKFSQ